MAACRQRGAEPSGTQEGRALDWGQAKEPWDLGQVPTPSLGLSSLLWNRGVFFILRLLLETYYVSGTVSSPGAQRSTKQTELLPSGSLHSSGKKRDRT